MMQYHMTDIIPLLPIPSPPRGTVSYDIPCPICDRPGINPSDGHCNINLKKDVFRCPKCGQFEGGVFALYAYYENIPVEKARESIKAQLEGRAVSPDGKRRPPAGCLPEPDVKAQAALTDIDTRHRTYSALLNKLSLASDHRENLLERGLNDTSIARLQYRTTPVVGFHALAKELVDEGYQLFGVPGFYQGEDGRWILNITRRGIMIPCRDRLGRIQRIHVRLDNMKHNKFRPLSSGNKLNGCATENWCHLVGPVRETILLIEGYMKADIVHHFTGQTMLAIPGVTSIHHLRGVLQELISLGVKHVMTCFDMDYLKNWHVESAYVNLLQLLGGLDITFGTYLWAPDYNGLDDYIWEFCLDEGRFF